MLQPPLFLQIPTFLPSFSFSLFVYCLQLLGTCDTCSKLVFFLFRHKSTQDIIASSGTPSPPRGERASPPDESQTPWNRKLFAISLLRGVFSQGWGRQARILKSGFMHTLWSGGLWAFATWWCNRLTVCSLEFLESYACYIHLFYIFFLYHTKTKTKTKSPKPKTKNQKQIPPNRTAAAKAAPKKAAPKKAAPKAVVASNFDATVDVAWRPAVPIG